MRSTYFVIDPNSVPNKFEQLKELVKKHTISSLVQKQNVMIRFLLRNFNGRFLQNHLSQIEIEIKGGGVVINIRDDIPGRLLLKHVFSRGIEGLYI